MLAYSIRRLLMIIPTIIIILGLNFFIIQAAPGGPVDQIIAQMQGHGNVNLERAGGGSGGAGEVFQSQSADAGSNSRAARGLDPEIIQKLNHQFGFDKPLGERFFSMVWNYLRFDFGESYFLGKPVLRLILEKLPVSISLGLWSSLIIYGISIPLGVLKAIKAGSRLDWLSSFIVIGLHAIPAFLLAVFLIILLAGGQYWQIFPLRGLFSDNWADLSLWGKIKDYFWHLALPIGALSVGGFASLTMLTRNSFLEEIGKQYVLTARARGLNQRQVYYGHVFRNAMLIVIAGFPASFIGMFFTGSLLIEIIFSLDGLGLLGFSAAINRDYPLMFATVYIFSLMGLVLNLVSDLTYAWVDPRIDFESRS